MGLTLLYGRLTNFGISLVSEPVYWFWFDFFVNKLELDEKYGVNRERWAVSYSVWKPMQKTALLTLEERWTQILAFEICGFALTNSCQEDYNCDTLVNTC